MTTKRFFFPLAAAFLAAGCSGAGPGDQPGDGIDFSPSFLTSPTAAGVGFPVTMNQQVLALAIDFADVPLTAADLAGVDSTVFDTSGNSVRLYYNEISYGRMDFSKAPVSVSKYSSVPGETIGQVRPGVSVPCGYSADKVDDGVVHVHLSCNSPFTDSARTNPPWPSNDWPQDVFLAAIVAADRLVDFHQFDTNGNGVLDREELAYVLVQSNLDPSTGLLVGGAGNFASTTFGLPLDGVTVGGQYSYVNAWFDFDRRPVQVGMIAHELGHQRFRFTDLYGSIEGASFGVGTNSLMSGSFGALAGAPQASTPIHLDAYYKTVAGFATPATIHRSDIVNDVFVSMTLSPTGVLDTATKIVKLETDTPNEYFLLENRQFIGYERGLAVDTRHPGVAIWHIDETIPDDNGKKVIRRTDIEESTAYVNGYMQYDNRPAWKTGDDSRQPLNDVYFRPGSQTYFGNDTFPSSFRNNGAPTFVRLSVGAPAADGSVVVSVNDPNADVSAQNEFQYLSNLTPTSASNGAGSYKKDASQGGSTLTVGRMSFFKGLGTRAPAELHYALGGKYVGFEAHVGVDDECGEAVGAGLVQFQVSADGQVLYQSGNQDASGLPQHVRVPLTGKNELVLTVTSPDGDTSCDDADWGEARLLSNATYLSDVSWFQSTATNKIGPPERDQSNGGSAVNDGRPLSIHGMKFDKGLGVKTPSSLEFALHGAYEQFTAWIGADDSGSKNGSVVYEVWADAKKLYSSGTVKATSAAKHVQVNVHGKQKLKLVANYPSGSTTTASADWADARLEKSALFLSDLSWLPGATSLGALNRDSSVGDAWNVPNRGYLQRIGGVDYAKGIGVHANSDVQFDLTGLPLAYTHFLVDVGVDDEVSTNGDVTFQVYVDGVLKASVARTYLDPAAHIDVSVVGAKNLELKVLDNGDANSDHADWANARLALP